MIDLRGAVVEGPTEEDGRYRITQNGFVHPAWMEMLPGVWPPSGDRLQWCVPKNMLPARQPEARPVEIPSGKVTPRRYQCEAVDFLLHAARGGLLSLDVGLGKTLAALAVAHAMPSARPILVVGPLITSRVWVGPNSDPTKHFGWEFFALRTTKPGIAHDMPPAIGYFCNHEILADWQMVIENVLKPKFVIIDESHILRTPKRLDCKVARRLARTPWAERVVLMTATPVVNRVSDLWAQLDAVEPGQWGSKNEFIVRWAGGIPSEFFDGYEETGETNIEELRDRLQTVMFRRSRFEVRNELPPFERQIARLPLESLEARAYKKFLNAKRNIVHVILQQRGRLRGVPLQQANEMHKNLSLAKVPAAVEVLSEMIGQFGSVVVFCWYQETARAIVNKLRRSDVSADIFGPITSSTTHKKRDEAASKFQSAAAAVAAELAADSRDSTNAGAASAGAVFVATLGTSGMAINELSAAPAALFVDLYWVPATLLQAEGRIHREGQRASQCFARYLVVDGTIDEVMYMHLEHKSEVIAKIADDATGVSLCESLGGATKQTKDEAFREMLAGLMAAEALEH